MALGLILNLVNSCGHVLVTTFSTLISLNYVLGEKIVGVSRWIGSWIATIVITLANAVQIILEDLLVFLKEGAESVVFLVECVFAVVDAVIGAVTGTINTIHGSIIYASETVARHCANVAQGVSNTASQSATFFNLLGESVLLLLNLVPRTIYLIFQTILSVSTGLCVRLRDLGTLCVNTCRSAPLEMLIGLFTGVILVYAFSKLLRQLTRWARDLIRTHEITPGLVLRTAAATVVFVYLNFVRGVILFFGTLCHVVIVTLANFHVPRFHHAGDSDVEDELDNQGKVSGQKNIPTPVQQLMRHVFSGGSAALLGLYDGLDLLHSFEVRRCYLLEKCLKNLIRRRGLEVQENFYQCLGCYSSNQLQYCS